MKPIADNVMAATHRLVQHAMAGRWEDVPKTVQERRELLDSLSASTSPQDRQWLEALKEAMAESDAAVAQIAAVNPVTNVNAASMNQGTVADATGEPGSAEVDSVMEMLKKSR